MKMVYAASTRPRVGEEQNGDAVITRVAGNVTLLGIIDALGHGEHAAHAAAVAMAHLAEAPLDAGLSALVDELHVRLRGTRGAAIALCSVVDDQLTYCAVGNVETRVFGSKLALLPSPGVVGGSLRRVRVTGCQIRGGDRLLMFSDGISGRFAGGDLAALSPADACARILQLHSKPQDDATVLVADVERS